MIFSRMLAFPFIALLAFGLFKIYSQDQAEWNIAIIAAVIPLAVIYVFSQQVNLWWWSHYPPQLDTPVRKMLYRSLPSLTDLTDVQKEEFERKLSLYLKTCEFIGMEIKHIPEDVKAAVLAPGVFLSIVSNQPNLYEHYQRAVVYQHPFLTPDIPDEVHTVEINRADGVLILSMSPLVEGLIDPQAYMHLSLYAFGSLLEAPVQEPTPSPHQDRYQRLIGLDMLSPSGIYYHDIYIHPEAEVILQGKQSI